MYTVTVKTDGTKTVQSKSYNDLLSSWLHLITDFVLTQRKLAHGPVKFPARSISHFAMNIIMASWLNRQSKFRQMTYFQQSAKLSSRQNFWSYGICVKMAALWGSLTFTKLLFALSPLAQPFNRMKSISEHLFVILSQHKSCAGRFREETVGKRTGPITKWPPQRLQFTRLEIAFVTISLFIKRTQVAHKVFQEG